MSEQNPVDSQKRIANLQAQYERRLSNLAQELALAGMQTLVKEFGFTDEQAARWLDKMLAQAKANRASESETLFAKWATQGRKE